MSDYREGSFVCCAVGCDRPKGHIPIACSINVGFGVGLAEWGSKSTFALQDSESPNSDIARCLLRDHSSPKSGSPSTVLLCRKRAKTSREQMQQHAVRGRQSYSITSSPRARGASEARRDQE